MKVHLLLLNQKTLLSERRLSCDPAGIIKMIPRGGSYKPNDTALLTPGWMFFVFVAVAEP
jgi:hypothetical protein